MSSNRNRGWPTGRGTHNRAQSFIHRVVSLSMAVVLPLASTLVLGVRVAVAQSGTCTGRNCSQNSFRNDLVSNFGLNADQVGAIEMLNGDELHNFLVGTNILDAEQVGTIETLKAANQCQGGNCNNNNQCQGGSCNKSQTADGYNPTTGRDQNGAGSMGGGSGGGGGGGAGGMLAGLMGKMGQLLPLLLMMLAMQANKSPSPAPDPNTLPGVPTLVPTLTPAPTATPLPTATATPRASGTPEANLSGF